jgi:signal transduction histidine kinase
MRPPRDRFVARCLLIVAALISFRWETAAWAQERQKTVLVLYSMRRDAQFVVTSERELPRLLDQKFEGRLDYYSEYLDLARFPGEDYQQTFRDYLQEKYRGRHIDVVVAAHEIARDFVNQNRDALFPGVPVVFYTNTPRGPILSGATGIVNEIGWAQTLQLARVLQPDLQHVFVVAGSAAGDRGFEAEARAAFGRVQDDLDIQYLSGLPMHDIERRLRSLPARSAVYFVTFYQDVSGRNFSPTDYLSTVAEIANAPTYACVDSNLASEYAIVGGHLLNQKQQIAALAELVGRVLLGEPVSSIPVSTVQLGSYQVDWRQLQRWGISEARVPVGTRLLYREPSAWERYRGYILGAIALIFILTGRIAGLLVQATQRQQAERLVRDSQVNLRTSYERIRDLGSRLLNAQEHERSRIARELHDDISQQLALLAMDLEMLNTAEENAAERTELAREASSRVQILAKSVHDLSHRLHPAKLQLIGLVSALDGLVRDFSQPGLRITFSHEGVPRALSGDVTVCVFRVVQEALRNAVRHSGAHEISVRLSGTTDRLRLTIVDDGVGFDPGVAWGSGLGLISMRERLDPLGGKLEIVSARGSGTRLEISVPYGQVIMENVAV